MINSKLHMIDERRRKLPSTAAKLDAELRELQRQRQNIIMGDDE